MSDPVLALLRAHGEAAAGAREVPRHGHQALEANRPRGVVGPDHCPRIDQDDLQGLDGSGRSQDSA